MPTKIIRDPAHVDDLADLLREQKLPITVSWSQGAPRTRAQNRLAQRWFTDIANQLGDQTHEDVRAMCKLHFGVPILRAENEAFCASYDRVMKMLPYDDKLAAIKAFDMPITRLMLTKQMASFMDAMQQYWSSQGVRLTDPEALKYEHEFGSPQ